MMMSIRRTVLGAIAFSLAVAVPALGQMGDDAPKSADNKAKIGEPAPAFTLKDTNGKEFSLSQYKGKVVVLEWFNQDCPYVQKHHAKFTTMKDTAAKFSDKGVVWLAIATGGSADVKANEKARKDWNISYPVLQDTTGEVGKLYKAKRTPEMYIINTDGVLMYQGAIDDNPSAGELGKVNYVERALTRVLSGETVEQPETRAYGCTVKYKN